MNRQKFIEYLRNPQQLSTTQLDELEELLVDYPYFQDGRTLLAKGKKLLSVADAQKYITSAAVYAPDRLLLKKYLSQDLFFLKHLKIPIESEEIEEPEKRVEPVADKLKAATPEANPTVSPLVPPLPKQSEPKEEQTTRAAAKTDLSTKPPSDLDALIAEIMVDIEELKKSKARFKAINAKLEEEDAINEAIEKSSKKPDSESSNAASEVKKKEIVKANKEEIPTETKATPATKAPVKKTASVKSQKASTIPTKKSSGKKAETKESPKQSSSPKTAEIQKDEPDKQEKQQQNEIIEDFIKNEPSIQRKTQKKDVDKATNDDLAAKSSRFHVDVSSEYLAEIYIGQGKNARAIEIYENLGLKFPEKSAYFAGLIENLKKKES